MSNIFKRPFLNKEQFKDAFAVSETTPLYVAFQQRITDFIKTSKANEASACSDNNPLSLAACAGAVDVLETLLEDMEEIRKWANK